jgi:hypothetical protein
MQDSRIQKLLLEVIVAPRTAEISIRVARCTAALLKNTPRQMSIPLTMLASPIRKLLLVYLGSLCSADIETTRSANTLT